MRILQICDIPNPSSYHEYAMSVELLRIGNQIAFIRPFKLSMSLDKNIYMIKNIELKTLQFIVALENISNFSPDIVYCHDFLHPEKSVTTKYVLKKFKKIHPKLILDCHTFYFLEKSRLSSVKTLFLKMLAKELIDKAKIIYATSATAPAVYKYLVNRINIPAEKVKQLELCVDADMFSPKYKKCSMCLRERTGVPEEARVLLTVGGIRPYKKLELILHALSKLIKNEKLTPKDVVLVIIGNGGRYSKYLQKLSIALGLFNRFVKFLGKVEWHKLPKYYAMADLAIFTAPTVSILEALASGLPLLCYEYFPSRNYPYAHAGSTYCCCGNGFLFELTSESIYSTLEKVLTLSDKELKEMGYRSRKLAEEKYSCKKIVNKLIRDLSDTSD